MHRTVLGYCHFYTRQRAEIPDSSAKCRTRGNPTLPGQVRAQGDSVTIVVGLPYFFLFYRPMHKLHASKAFY